MYKYGEGDDDGTLEDDFNEWKADLWEELKKVVDVTFVTSGTQPNENKNALPFVLTVTKEKEIDFEQYDPTKDQKNYESQMKQYCAQNHWTASENRRWVIFTYRY